MRQLLFGIVWSLCIPIAYAQHTEWVRGAQGQAYIAGDVSPNEAKRRAIEDAKKNALIQAGIAENIASHQMQSTVQADKSLSKAFSADVISQMQGAILRWEQKDERQEKNDVGVTQLKVWIDAEVIHYDKKPDDKFTARVEGIKPSYANGESLQFEVKCSQEAYLTVFALGEKESNKLFPTQYEKPQKMEVEKLYRFPLQKVDYAMENTLGKNELNRIFLVFTKEYIPFVYKETEEDMMRWIWEISPDQRRVEQRSFMLMK